MVRRHAWFLAVAVAFCAHLLVVRAHAVDLPYLDEWDLLAPGGLPRGLTLEWLLALHNEHRIPLTKLQVWAHLRLDGWDNVAHVTSTFLLFGATLSAILAWLVRRGLPPAAAAASGLLLLSPIAFQNHAWGFQSQVHLALLGLFLAAPGLASVRGRERALGVAALALGALSFAAGVVFGLALLVAFAAREAARRRREEVAPDARRSSLAVLGAGGLVLVLWSIGWERGDLTPGSPLAWRTWDTWLNLVALGFGFETPSAALGAGCLAVVVTPVGLGLARAPDDDEAWHVAAVALALLLGLAAIASARAAWGPLYVKASRYAELALPLAPVAALSWWRLLAARPRARVAAVALVLALAAIGLQDDWTRDGYRAVEAHKRAALARLNAWRGGPLRAPEVYPGRLDERVEAARALGVSFMRAR